MYSKYVIKSPVHGLIRISKEERAFIHTPEFQRLLHIMQLGNCFYVFPSATHKRYLHSLEVMYISGEFYDNLMENSPELKKKYGKYVRLIRLAGLLHDLGHGPKSHLFEEWAKLCGINFHHESFTIELIKKINRKLKILNDEDLDIVCAMIQGNLMPGYPNFLFRVVANKESGLDLDKIAYLMLDTYMVGLPGIDIGKIMNFAYVVDGEIAFHPTARGQIENVFKTRVNMLNEIYFDPTVKKIDKLFICALKQLPIDDEKIPDSVFQWNENKLMAVIEDMNHHVIQDLIEGNYDNSCEHCPKVELDRTVRMSREAENPMNFIRFLSEF
jgi:deoxynucleoside triphosphate triphosphohydrolase SAMHD1